MFFKNNPSTRSASPASSQLSACSTSTDTTSDLSHCRYSSYYSTQCVNGHCDTVRKQFRQCEERPAEELVTDEAGRQQWQPSTEAAMRTNSGGGLSADVSWPDPVTSIFDELRTQTQLMGQAFKQWDGRHTDTDKDDTRDEQRENGNDDGGIVSEMLNALHGASRDFVDALFERPTQRPSTPRRTREDSSGDADDEV